MRAAYAVLTYLLLPFYSAYWLIRAVGNPSYRDRLSQRFGFAYPRMSAGCLWIHAVSVGEVQASVPLVNALLAEFPHRHILITTVTPTGAERVRLLFGDSVAHCYIPFETPTAVNRFFNRVRPIAALVMETEIWPNLYYECGKREVPLILVSARISPKSVKNYRRFMPLFRETLSYGIVIAAQSDIDAERFRSLGAAAERVHVTGNIKFDIELSDGIVEKGERLRRDNFEDRPVWVAASTHDGEEALVLQAHRLIRRRFPNALLVLVPRHPERFNGVRSALHKDGFSLVSRSDHVPSSSETQVFLVDTMGELPLFYAAGNVAFVGGTLVPVGGHNLLEPAALGKPIVTGPHLFNTQDIADKFARNGASIIVHDASELAQAVGDLFADESAARDIGERGRRIVAENRGALEQLMALVRPLIAVER